MDNKELEKIYNDTYRSVYWTAMSLLRDEDEAQDIVQETFVTLIDSYDTLRDKEKVAAWLKKIAANKCLDRLRRTKTVNEEDDFFENVEAQPEDFLPDSILESAEKRKIIMNIIDNALSEDVRRTLILFYYDEMTTKEIASLLGIPQGTVLWRLNYAKKKIKKEVEKYEEENNDKLYAMAVPFLSKLFAKEAEQVPLRPMPATLVKASASGSTFAKAATANKAATTAAGAAVKGGLGIALNKIIIAVIVLVLAVAMAIGLITHLREEPEETTEETTYSESEETEETTTEETTDTASASDALVDLSADLIGTWVGSDNSNNAVYMTFNDDGTMDYWMTDPSGAEIYRDNCTYTLNGNEMEMIRSDGTSSGLLSLTLDGDTLTVEDPNSPDEPMVFTRTELTEVDHSASAVSADPASALIGTWSAPDGDNVVYLTFYEDNTIEMVERNAVGEELDRDSITYSVEGNVMTWSHSSGATMQVTFTVDGDTLILENPDYPDELVTLTRTDAFSAPVYSAADLVGTWVAIGTGAHPWMTFYEDGTLEVWVIDANGNEIDRGSGSFSVEGNQLRVDLPDNGFSETYSITIDGDTMYLASSGQPDFVFGYSRQA